MARGKRERPVYRWWNPKVHNVRNDQGTVTGNFRLEVPPGLYLDEVMVAQIHVWGALILRSRVTIPLDVQTPRDDTTRYLHIPWVIDRA